MVRWTALCVFLCVLTVGLVVYASHLLGQTPLAGIPGQQQAPPPGPNPDKPVNVEVSGPGSGSATGGPLVDKAGPLSIEPINKAEAVTALQYMNIEGGRIQTILRQEVAVEHDGKLVYLATEVKPGEVVPPNKKVVAASWMVAIRDKNVAPENRLIVENPEKGAVYRKWLPADGLPPDRLRVGYVMKTYRKLVEGDMVQAGDLVALVDTELARDELSSKVAQIDVAESELQTSIATKDEAKSRLDREEHANLVTPGAYAIEEVNGARLTYTRYFQEEAAKRASLVKAQREANAAITILRKHEVRAQIAGEIKIIYKHADEAIKNLDPVLQIQNPYYLRVEAMLDVQDLSKVKKGMTVTVEPTTPKPPDQILSGHLQAVLCVAVSKAHKTAPGQMPVYTIVSGSEDRMVIGWNSRTGDQLWRMPHRAVIRAVACTGEKADSNLALIGAADGSGEILDLDKLKEDTEKCSDLQTKADELTRKLKALKNNPEEVERLTQERDAALLERTDLKKHMVSLELEKRHHGAILCAAFSTDGKTCATSGDDRTINLWDAETGKLKGSIRAAHRAAVTSLQFTPQNILVSAGRDGAMNFWSVKPDEPPHKAFEGLDSRGGEVSQLGVSSDGQRVLYDQGKELLVLSLAKRRPEGVLQNYGVSGNFTNMALFAPNGKTILTASAAEKRLQLWRTPTADGRAGEVRQFIWSTGLNTCGAFAPHSEFAVTGTQDHKVLIWKMPSEEEINTPVKGTVSWVDESFSAGSTRQVRIWVDVNNTDPKKLRRLIPGSIATLVVPPANP